MRDLHDSPEWGENHAALSNGVHHILSAITVPFLVLNRIAWSAPWRQEEHRPANFR